MKYDAPIFVHAGEYVAEASDFSPCCRININNEESTDIVDG